MQPVAKPAAFVSVLLGNSPHRIRHVIKYKGSLGYFDEGIK